MALGLYLSLDAPCATSAALAVAQAVLPKTDWLAFDTHANFRNHPGDLCRDPGHVVNNQAIAKLMKSGPIHCNQLGHATDRGGSHTGQRAVALVRCKTAPGS
jgi:hypothetical protein